MKEKAKSILKDFLKKSRNVFYIFLLGILWIVVPPFVSWMLKNDPLILPDFFGFVNSRNFDAWVGFYGNIIGGVITLIGVAWTIIDQNKKREMNMKDAFKPILIATSCTYEKIKDIKNEKGSKVFECCIEYKNVGNGVLYNPAVIDVQYSIDNKEYGKLHMDLSVNNCIDIGSTASNTVMLELNPQVLNNILNDLKGRGDTVPLQITMYVGGKDMFGRDVVTKLFYESELILFSTDDIHLPLHGGTLTSKILFSSEEVKNIVLNASNKYNVHR